VIGGVIARIPRLDVVSAIALFALGCVLFAVRMPLVFGAGSWQAPGWVRFTLLVAVCAIDLLRTRAPVPALLAGLGVAAVDATLGLSLGVLLVLVDLLYSATLHGPRRASRIIVVAVGVVMLAVAVSSLSLVDDLRQAFLITLQLGTFPVVPVWWALNVRQQREIAEAERARADQLERIAELDRRAAVAAERSRMARDLHDVIAGHLSAIAIQSAAALSLVDRSVDMRTVLASVRENSLASLTEMRTMIGLLRSDDAKPGEDRTAPARLADLEPLLGSARAAGLTVDANIQVRKALPVAVDLSAYRIIQEALTNAVKHAPGSRVEVAVGARRGGLIITVTNERDEAGQQDGGIGLVNMRERAQAVGGTLTAGPDNGVWRVQAELPVEGV
jgi:signal transduction histidine kinase